jgi:hypothetical protein
LEALWVLAGNIVDSMGDIFYDPEAFHDSQYHDYESAWYADSPNEVLLTQARKQVFAGLVQVKFLL